MPSLDLKTLSFIVFFPFYNDVLIEINGSSFSKQFLSESFSA